MNDVGPAAQPITCLIVDDEPLARAGVLDLARNHPELRPIAEARSVEEAESMIGLHAPELVFLDIHLPDGDGLDLPARLASRGFPPIIVTSAYGEHALRGFDIGVEDYLLKPIQEERFAQAVDRARSRVLLRRLGLGHRYVGLPSIGVLGSGGAERDARGTLADRMFVREGSRHHALAFNAIHSLEAAGDYVCIAMQDGVLVCGETLKSLASRLPPEQFMPIHRSRVIRIDAVEEVKRSANGTFEVRLCNGTAMRSSKGYRDAILRLLGARAKRGQLVD